MNSQIEIYQSADGQSQVNVRFEQDTIWLNQKQMSSLFAKDVRTISEHIQNIYLTGELEAEGTIRKFRIVRQEGKREVNRQVEHYNLDMIISVGYRVNSHQGTQFRIWATQRLKEYLVQGYAINRQRLEQQQMEIEHLKSGIRIWSRALTQKSEREDLDWLTIFAKGLTLLDDYDHENLESRGQNLQPALYPSWDEYQHIIAEMKKEFDSAVFGKEKDSNFRSSIAQITKGMGEEDFYPSLEEKAAMLLYLITKNHSFVDGNKRIAAACFLLFLAKNELLFKISGQPLLSNDALASLTLFIAASKPAEMETVKRLIVSILNRNQS